jgi:hypothetical protein
MSQQEQLQEPKKKKKGRPRKTNSKNYVSEEELREEIRKSQEKKNKRIEEIKADYDKKIKECDDEECKNRLKKEMEEKIKELDNKSFCTDRLAEMILLTVDRIGTEGKYRYYSYLEDMKAEAIYQAVKGIVKFNLEKTNDEGKKSSAFSYLTQIINNAFKQIIKKEKKSAKAKDSMIEKVVDESNVDLEFDSIKRIKEKALLSYESTDADTLVVVQEEISKTEKNTNNNLSEIIDAE